MIGEEQGKTPKSPYISGQSFKQRVNHCPVWEATPPLPPALARRLGFEEQLSTRWDIFFCDNFLGPGFCRSKELDEVLIASNVITKLQYILLLVVFTF